MTIPGVPLEIGAFTPALRSLALDMMEELLVRPAAIAISDQTHHSAGTFRAVRDRLTKKKYTTLAEWKEEVVGIFNTARTTGDEMVGIVCEELDRWFSKRYNKLLKLSEFRFKDALTEVVEKIKQARDSYAAETDE
jgi:hypothetical protein